MEKNEVKCTGMKCHIKDGNIVKNSVDVQTVSEKGSKITTIPLIDLEGSSSYILEQVKKTVASENSVVTSTSYFDGQMIRFENTVCTISAMKQKEILEDELKRLREENNDLTSEGQQILVDNGFSTEAFDPGYETPDYIRDGLSEAGVLEDYEDICSLFYENELTITELENLQSSKKVELTENFCEQKPEVQARLDSIIRSASFASLYIFFTAYRGSKGYKYDYNTKKIMQCMPLLFCDVVDGEIDCSKTELCYQALKDMAYELYKSIPGKEYKED